IVEFVGAGAQRQVELRKRHPLAEPLTALFRAEGQRFDDLTHRLMALFLEPPVPPAAAWVEGPAPGGAAAHVRLDCVAGAWAKQRVSDYLTEWLPDVDRTHGIHVVVTGLTRSELEALPRVHANALESPVLLDGVPPAALQPASRERTAMSRSTSHRDHDAR